LATSPRIAQLADDESQFHAIADRLWGVGAPRAGTVRKVGKGRVYTGMTANEVLKALDLDQDFSYTNLKPIRS